jgi:hypothetical protein
VLPWLAADNERAPMATALLAACRGRASFLDHFVAEQDALRIIFLEPLIGKLWRREYLEIVVVANFLVGIDINPNGCIGPSSAFAVPGVQRSHT